MNLNNMNPAQFMQEFNKFKADYEKQNPGVDPQKKVEELVRTGKMSLEQYENLRNMANLITGMHM